MKPARLSGNDFWLSKTSKMSIVQTPPPSTSAFPKSSLQVQQDYGCSFLLQSSSNSVIPFKRLNIPKIRASTESASSVATDLSTELNAVSRFSEIVPDTVIFDDFERFPPKAATVSSSLLLGICSLPDSKFKSAIDTALADGECIAEKDPSTRLSCFYDKALVNVGADLAKLVPGRVSTEVDARLAYDTTGIIMKVHELLKLYNERDVLPERLLFKIPSTWQGIEASRLLESEGIQTHVTFVYSFAQAAAAAQAGASVIQIFVGRIRDWARHHTGDRDIKAAIGRGEDPGLVLGLWSELCDQFRDIRQPDCFMEEALSSVTKAYNYIHRNGHKSNLMVAAIRNKHDIFSLLGVDYIIAPLKILQSLKESVTPREEKYSFVRKLSPVTAMGYNFSKAELVEWDQQKFASSIGPAAGELLGAGLEGYVNQTRRMEELFGKIWPPPNV